MSKTFSKHVDSTNTLAFTDGPRFRRAPQVTPEGQPYHAPTERDARGFGKRSHASLAQFQAETFAPLPLKATR